MTRGKSSVDNSLIGIAGVHYVVSELSFRGLIALQPSEILLELTSWFRVLMVNGMQITGKSSKKKCTFWLLGSRYKKLTHPNEYFVFVRYLEKNPNLKLS